jgi:hypothetical protein
MGTRSLTRVIDTDFSRSKEILCLYRQFDGYPSVHGQELAGFLDGMNVVNGLGAEGERKIANGAGCLAAQLVAHFKTEPGGFYIYAPGSQDCGEEYVYEVRVGAEKGLYIDVRSGYHPTFKKIFSGDVAAYLQWVKAEKSA